ncbi:hypothetical protein [Variovorax sp. DT-64]|uniref:hypothetical protein n=1 Tax=Variovorax sp. DT-64 TaxID=3396160 RepID=UPI003F1A656F
MVLMACASSPCRRHHPRRNDLLVSVVGLVVGFPLISIWTLFGVAIGRFLSSPRHLKAFNGAMALSLVVLAVSLAV